jgi:hypothetical protein
MKVFLSHSSLDKAYVRRVKAALAPHGPDSWLDECELFPGDSLFDKIAEAITESDCVLVFISENSVKSGWVKRELSSFLAREETALKPLVIPVILDRTEPPVFLAPRLQVRAFGKSLGSVTQELLRGVLRSHAVLLMRPVLSEFFRLEPFGAKVAEFKSDGVNATLRTVFDSFELADVLGDAIGDEPDEGTLDLKAAIPGSFEVLAAICPKVIQVVLSLEPGVGGPSQAERLIQLVWRIVMLTFVQALRRHGDEKKIQSNVPYDLPGALREYDEIRSNPGYYYLGYGIRPAVWLQHHRTILAESRDFAFTGRQMSDGTRIQTAPHIFIPNKYIRRVGTTWSPELDFMPYQWMTGVLPLIVANAVVHSAFTGLATAQAVATIGLRPKDYEAYG